MSDAQFCAILGSIYAAKIAPPWGSAILGTFWLLSGLAAALRGAP